MTQSNHSTIFTNNKHMEIQKHIVTVNKYFYFWSILLDKYQSTSITVLHWEKRKMRNITMLNVAILTTVWNVSKQRGFHNLSAFG